MSLNLFHFSNEISIYNNGWSSEAVEFFEQVGLNKNLLVKYV